MRAVALVLGTLAVTTGLVACRDVTRFSSKGDRFEGAVVKGSFVRSGVVEDARMCLTLDTDHLQDAPGTITTTDGRFRLTALRPIPQIWHDPLSTFNFGDGRVQNLMYAAAPQVDGGRSVASDILVIVSLMQTDHIEVRLLRGAPESAGAPAAPGPGDGDGGAPVTTDAVFGVFNLDRQPGPCSF